MKHPPYHLRSNKAVDRLLLIDLLQRSNVGDGSGFHYYGFGGPFMEDFRLIYNNFPNIKLTSLEKNRDTIKRQKRHLPSKRIRLVASDATSFLSTFEDSGDRAIIWLDYTSFKKTCLENFRQCLEILADDSICRVTITADVPGEIRKLLLVSSLERDDSWQEKLDNEMNQFRLDFGEYVPATISMENFTSQQSYVELVVSMFQLAAQSALPAAAGRIFQLLSLAKYSDGSHTMLSITGSICSCKKAAKWKSSIKRWRFHRFDWQEPVDIDLPDLSIAERIALESHLPLRRPSGRLLARVLGYRIDDSTEKSLGMLERYSEFHRYYSTFIKIGI